MEKKNSYQAKIAQPPPSKIKWSIPKCSGKMGTLFNLDGFEATRLQPSRIARRKADLQGFETPQAL